MRHGRQDGFALILAILSLMVLTVLALAVASITSIDVEIAGNQRWAEQARYNAEAGLEIGRRVLADIEWQDLLWTPRTPWTLITPADAPTVTGANDAYGNAPRNWEMGGCDARGGHVGYGRVVEAEDGTVYQNVSQVFGKELQGTFTLWVRRAVNGDASGHYKDDPSNTRMTLTVEGTAPFLGENLAARTAGASARKVRATFRMEATLSRSENAGGECGTRAGQAGGGQEGANLGACDPLGAAGLTAALDALGALPSAGAVTEINRSAQ